MRNPRRPPADRRRASGTRERPVSWNRRLDEAREARARVLAAREAQGGDDPAVRASAAAGAAASGGGPTGADAAPPREDETSGKRPVAARLPFRWWIAGGLLAGAAAGAAIVWAVLPGDPVSLPGATTGNPEAPVVASGPAQPAPDPSEAQSATEALEVEELAADDGAENAGEAVDIAALPEITAADRARAVGRRAAAPDERAAAAEIAPDATGTATSATSSLPEETTGAVSVTDIATQADEDLAPSQSDRPLPPPDEASSDERPETAAGAVGEREGSPETARAAAPPKADVAAADIATADSSPEEDGGSGATESGRDAEEAATPPEPAPAEDPPRPPEALEAATPDAGDEPQGAPAAGAGLLYVHAAPGVSSAELADVAARLSEAGYSVEDTRRVDFRISQTNVRFFHDEDAEIAAGVAETISGISRDFTTYQPSPDPGTIEVWLEG